MSSASRSLLLISILTLHTNGLHATNLRVCADPNNLPYSNQHQEGFENRLAELIARDLGMKVVYLWLPQREAFFRKTLGNNVCDVVMGVPTQLKQVTTTAPYYRSNYVFVSRSGRHLTVRSFDDPILRKLKIGVNVLGESTESVPPVHSLILRGLSANLVGYSIFGNLDQKNPGTTVIDAVAHGEVDLAVAWGPTAGYAIKRASLPLNVTPIESDPLQPTLPFSFDIAIGVRAQDESLRQSIDRDLRERRTDIERLLHSYGVPCQHQTSDDR